MPTGLNMSYLYLVNHIDSFKIKQNEGVAFI